MADNSKRGSISEAAPGCLLVVIFLVVATAIFATIEWALSWIGIADITPKSWWGHYSELIRLFSSLFSIAVISAAAIALVVGSVFATTRLLTWQRERRLRYLATNNPEAHAFLVEAVGDWRSVLALLYVSQSVPSMIGIGLLIAEVGSLFWFTLLATALPLAVFYLAAILSCRGAGRYALYQVRRFLFPYVFVTPLLFSVTGIVIYLVYYAQAWIFIALGLTERIRDFWFFKLASIPPTDIDYLAIAHGTLWSIGAIPLIVAILPLFVLRAYGMIAAGALGCVKK